MLTAAVDLRLAGTDGNLWWIDLWPLPLGLSRAILVAFAIAMIAWAVAPNLSRARRIADVVLIAIVLVAAIGNTIRYYLILARGDVRTTLPLPLSLLIASAMAAILIAHAREPRPNRRAFLISFVVAGIIFPIAQIALFGLTDYRGVLAPRILFSGGPGDGAIHG